MLLVVDALAEYGLSGGLEGQASSLDVASGRRPRSPSTTSARGDRVGLRVVGGGGEKLSCAAGRAAPAPAAGTAGAGPAGEPRDLRAERLRFGAAPGTVVIVLSPMLARGGGRRRPPRLAGRGLP